MAALAPEIITHIGFFPVTNTGLNTLLVDAAILSGVYFLNRHIKRIPGYFQSIFELITDTFYSMVESIAGKNVIRIFPWFMSFFLEEHGQITP